MIEATFGARDQQAKRLPVRLSSPTKILTAQRLEEVQPLLASASEAAQAGAWVALLLSYEAAPVFDPAMKTRPAQEFPLAWAAVFENCATAVDKPSESNYQVGPWSARVSRTEFGEAISNIREFIAAGDTYQVNYTFPLTAEFSGNAHAWFQDLCRAQGDGYFAYFDLGRFKVLSLSPELFFERTAELITTCPMKGTIARGRWSEEDEVMRETLANSAKDRAENVMIVDLLRNDLGRIAAIGSVHVDRLFAVERYETLWQMTSTISATLRANLSLFDQMKALFPCGSITGAPKIRTMEIIGELEPFPRGLYTGAIGFLRPSGDAVFNVAIRTVVVDSQRGTATLGVGGGITYDSTAEREYEECLVKISFLNNPVPEFELLESLVLEDCELFLSELHRTRMKSSAAYFGFVFDEAELLSRFDEIVAACPRGKWKVRLLLSRNCKLRHEVQEFKPLAEPLRVALAKTPVSSRNRFLFHKTTNRAVYDEALTKRPDCDDVLLWNERAEITEATVANVVVSVAGQLVTPPHDAGLLRGTFREQLLTIGVIGERTIRKDELQPGSELFLINSVQKWRRAILIE